MGLDIAEIIMDIEEEFDIVIPDESQGLLTVGDLVDYVAKRVGAVEGSDPLKAKALARLQDFFHEQHGIEKSKVGPASELASLVPERVKRLASLREAARVISRDIQPSELPKWLKRYVDVAVWSAWAVSSVLPYLAWTVVSGGSFWGKGLPAALVISGLVMAIPAFFCRYQLCELLKKSRWAIETYRTVADLLPVVAAGMKIGDGDSTRPLWTTETVETKVRAIVCRVADLPLSSVTREKKIVNDLGLG